MKILIIEDEEKISSVIMDKLKDNKYNVEYSLDGEEGLYMALSGSYDLIILDVMLPNINGIDILKKLRENKIESKIIMLTAKSTIDDKLEGFNNGADDYLTKPFHIEELLARVNTLLKINKDNNILKYEDIVLDRDNSLLKCNTNEVSLVCKEYQLMEYFIKNKERILSEEQLYDKVWGIDNNVYSNSVNAYLSFLRKKLKAINSKVTIKSVRGLGYKMEKIDEEVK